MISRPGVFKCVALLLIFLAAVPLAVMARNADNLGTETRLSDTWFRTRPARAPRADMVIVARDQKTLDAMRPTHADYGAVIRRVNCT